MFCLWLVNTGVNVLLVGGKTMAVLYSSSISLTASLVDSALDLLSTMIILGTSWAIGMRSEPHMVSHLIWFVPFPQPPITGHFPTPSRNWR